MQELYCLEQRMASMGDGVEVYTSEGPCGAASTQYRGLVMVSKVKSRNAFSDIRCVLHIYLCSVCSIHTSADREVRQKVSLCFVPSNSVI